MSEQAPQIKHSELHAAIDDASAKAQETTKRYSRVESPGGFKETILGANPLGGDPVSTIIERSDDRWYKDQTKIDVHAQKPSQAGEDPYHHAGTEYQVKIKGQIGANTRIQRTNERGEVVYTHESNDLQLARRIGMVGARSVARQSVERADFLKKAA